MAIVAAGLDRKGIFGEKRLLRGCRVWRQTLLCREKLGRRDASRLEALTPPPIQGLDGHFGYVYN